MIKNKTSLSKIITEKHINKVGNAYDYAYRQGVMDGTYNMLRILEEVLTESEGDIDYIPFAFKMMEKE